MHIIHEQTGSIVLGSRFIRIHPVLKCKSAKVHIVLYVLLADANAVVVVNGDVIVVVQRFFMLFLWLFLTIPVEQSEYGVLEYIRHITSLQE